MIRVTNVVTMDFIEITTQKMTESAMLKAINETLDVWLMGHVLQDAKNLKDLFGLIIIDTEDNKLRRAIVDHLDNALKMRENSVDKNQIHSLKERRVKAVVDKLREFDDAYEYCIIEDYEEKYDDFSCEAIQLGDIFVNLLETGKKTVLCSIHFLKEKFNLEQITTWIDNYNVNYNTFDSQGYFVLMGKEIIEKVLLKGNPVVLYSKGNIPKLYYSIENMIEVTDAYTKYNTIVNSANAKPVLFGQQNTPNKGIDNPSHDETFWREKLFEILSFSQESKAYYRPLVCNGKIEEIDIFLVGINPATPIYPHDIDLIEYVDLLLNHDKYLEYYSTLRLYQGKTKMSRTRIGMNSMVGLLKQHTNASIAETNVISYPTTSLEELKKEPLEIINHGKNIFYQLLSLIQPKLLIFHSKEALRIALEIMSNKGLIQDEHRMITEIAIKELESKAPVLEFTYENGKKGYILACRHLMYYGEKGNSFKEFTENVINIMKE